MRKIYSTVAALLFAVNVWAQAPQKMSYQAVVRDASSVLITSSNIGMQISILQGSTSGTAVYVETQTTSTNANGLVSLEIGNGTPVTGNFASINWANGPYFIKTETDPLGGTAYTISGTSELMSVPYALFSANGTAGAVGATGAAGTNGTNGLDGATGAAGTNGTNGTNGLDGATGAAGTNGTNGTNGLDGATGAAGTNGTNGLDGATGAAGTNGTNGTNGLDGATGAAGTNGTNGTNGLDGATGAAGTNGTNGLDGATGAAGAVGVQGIAGATGLLTEGAAAGNTPYWNGTSWVTNSSNIFNNGANIGIGTTTPDAPLTFPGTTGQKIHLYGAIANEYSIGIEPGEFRIATGTGAKMSFRTNGYTGTEAMQIANNGNVGIGTTPTERLTVSGTGTTYTSVQSPLNSQAGLKFQHGNATDWYLYREATNANFQIFNARTGTTDVIIDTTDQVTIRGTRFQAGFMGVGQSKSFYVGGNANSRGALVMTNFSTACSGSSIGCLLYINTANGNVQIMSQAGLGGATISAINNVITFSTGCGSFTYTFTVASGTATGTLTTAPAGGWMDAEYIVLPASQY